MHPHAYSLISAPDHTFFVGSGEPALMHSGEIDPTLVRFSRKSVSFTFKNGGNISELAEGLRNGTINPKSVPPSRLVERDGQLFTLDNRRLEAFRRAGIAVPYRFATPEEIAHETFKFTTNGGTSIRIRGDDDTFKRGATDD